MDPILVWKFKDAPEEYRQLSRNGGDEDWLAVVPKYLNGDYIGWLESGDAFGCCSVDEYYLPDGRLVYIGSHA